MATKTLQDVYDIAYGIIAQPQGSTAYPLPLITSFINKAQNDICYGVVKNLKTGERIKKQALTFLEKTKAYTTHNFTTLSSIAVVGGTTLSCVNSLAPSGYVWINGNIISYTGNTGTELTGIPTTGEFSIQFPFTSGTQVYQLDTLPTDYGMVSRVFLSINNVSTREKLISVDSRDLYNPVAHSSLYRFFFDRGYSTGYASGREWYYSIIQGRFILFLTPQINGQLINFEYERKPTQLVNPTDLLTIPDEYSLNTIPYLATAEMVFNRGEAQFGIELNNFGATNTQTMYEVYQNTKNEAIFGQRVRTVSDGGLNF